MDFFECLDRLFFIKIVKNWFRLFPIYCLVGSLGDCVCLFYLFALLCLLTSLGLFLYKGCSL